MGSRFAVLAVVLLVGLFLSATTRAASPSDEPGIEAHPDTLERITALEKLAIDVGQLSTDVRLVENELVVRVDDRLARLSQLKQTFHDYYSKLRLQCDSMRREFEELSRRTHELRHEVRTSRALLDSPGSGAHREQHNRKHELDLYRLQQAESRWGAVQIVVTRCDDVIAPELDDAEQRIQFLYKDVEERQSKEL